MRAIDVMSSSVVTVTPDTTVQEAAQRLLEHRVSGMPVLDEDGVVVGIVSEGDLLRRVEIGTEHARVPVWRGLLASTRALASTYVREHARTVADVMTPDPICVREDTPLAEIAELLQRRHFRRVPVVSEGELVGIVSRADLIRALASVLLDEMPSPSDDAIRDGVLRELAGHRWAQPRAHVVVKDGIVHLWGTIQSEEERRAICVAAEGIRGVRGVKSHLRYPVLGAMM